MDMQGYVENMEGITYNEAPYSPVYRVTWPKENLKAGLSFSVTADDGKNYFHIPAELILILAERINAVKQRPDLEEIPF